MRTASFSDGMSVRTYRLAGVWRVGTGLCSLFFIVGGWGLFVQSAAGQTAAPAWVPAVSLVLGVYALLLVVRAEILLCGDVIKVRSVFQTKSLAKNEIVGMRRVQRNHLTRIILIPQTKDKQRIAIAPYFQRDATFDAWLKTLPDLDLLERQKDENAFLHHTILGPTPAARAAQLARAQRVASRLFVFVLIVFAGAFFFPPVFHGVLPFLLLTPWVAVLLVMISRGLYGINMGRQSTRPELSPLVIFPGMVLALRAYEDMGTTDGLAVLFLSAGVTLILGGLSFLADHTTRKAKARDVLRRFLVLLLLAAPYGYGATLWINSLGDTSPAQTSRVIVMAKHMSSGRHGPTWYLRLMPWGPRATPHDEVVSAWFYKSVHPAGVVCTVLRSGAWGISWYVVKPCAN